MNQIALEKFSEELKKARTEKNISLDQIASKTRIDIKFLSAIESADFEVLPEVYIKAFIKEYAKFIELPVDSTIQKFEQARKGIYQEDESSSVSPVIEKEEIEVKKEYDSSSEVYTPVETNSKNSKNNMILIFGAVAFVVLLVILFSLFGGSEEQIITEKKEDSTKNTSELFKNEISNLSNKDSAIKSDYLNLKVSSSDTSWIKVIKDEAVAEEALMLPGNSKDFHAGQNFYLIVGNAAAISFELNSNRLNFKGDTNQVKSVFIDTSGLKYIRTNEIPGYNEQRDSISAN